MFSTVSIFHFFCLKIYNFKHKHTSLFLSLSSFIRLFLFYFDFFLHYSMPLTHAHTSTFKMHIFLLGTEAILLFACALMRKCLPHLPLSCGGLDFNID